MLKIDVQAHGKMILSKNEGKVPGPSKCPEEWPRYA